MEQLWLRWIPFGIFAIMTVWFLTVFVAGVVNVGSVVGFGVSLLLTLGCCQWDKVLKIFTVLQNSFGGKMGIAFIALVTVGLTVLAVFFSVKMSVQAANAPTQSDLPVIILGCKVNGDTPSRMLRYRLQTAETYLRQNPQTICVVSGGQGDNETRTEAGVMKEWLVAHGIHQSRILVEDASKNTEQNLNYSKKMLENVGISCENVILVTDGYHQYRASLFAKKQGMTAYGVSAKTDWHLLPTYWIREWFGLCKYFVFG